MILSPSQINTLLEIIDKNQLVVIGKELGPEFLNEADKQILMKYGIDPYSLYNSTTDTLQMQFQLGMLAEALHQQEVGKITFNQLKDYVSHGDYIPLTAREKATIGAIKNQTFTDLKKLRGNIFQDVNKVLVDNSIQGQSNFIQQELETGYLDKKTVSQISHSIAEKTGDWGRDFDRIVAYNSHAVYEEGKAAMIQRNNPDQDAIVYKTVFEGACAKCISLYLTNGIGSQPRLFKLSELRSNGTNIGRSVKEWKASLGPIHPYCRCLIHELPKGYVWDQQKRDFVLETTITNTIIAPKKRLPIRVSIGGIETTV